MLEFVGKWTILIGIIILSMILYNILPDRDIFPWKWMSTFILGQVYYAIWNYYDK